MTVAPRVRLIGPGRAGRSLGLALGRVGWSVAEILGRGEDVSRALDGVDLLVIATPDAAIPETAAAIEPDPHVVVAHLAGSLGLDVLAPHQRTAALHPLVALPDAETGAAGLASGAWFAIAGDPLVQRVVDDLGGRWFSVADADRPAYHAAAVVASNHLVALLGQVGRIAEDIGVPPAAYLDLARATLENVAALGPEAALTGPAARGDWATITRHLEAIDATEHEAYRALAAAARRLATGEDLPPDV